MDVVGRFQDGETAKMHNARMRTIGTFPEIVAIDTDTDEILARWPAGSVYPVYGRKDELRIGTTIERGGARMIFRGRETVAAVRDKLPSLYEHRQKQKAGQWRLAMLSTLALASVIGAYLYGIPMLATRLVALVPPQWEIQLGETAATQMEALVAEAGGFIECDADPDSVANRAIARFADRVLSEVETPFDLDIKVIQTDVPNAFALPGGKVYFFSALLEKSERPDEFAGVLAHEIGHVVYRHGMEQLIATAGTGALIGFVLGDLTGLSVAAGIGSTLIDARFSRASEREADRFAARIASRMRFEPSGLTDLLERVAMDGEFGRALALFSTHPLTEDRRVALSQMADIDLPDNEPAFTSAEWRAIRSMCAEAKSKS